MTRIITIASQKGGVGKTTTIVNLASWMALFPDKNKKTPKILVIDIDPQASASLCMGILPDKITHGGTYDVLSKSNLELLEEDHLSRVIYRTNIKNLDIAPSNMVGSDAESSIIRAAMETPNLLRDAIDHIAGNYDYILIDAPPTLSGLTKMAIAAADSVMVPMQCEYMALSTIPRFLDLVVEVRQSLNPWLQLEGLLLTMYDESSSNYSAKIAREARNQFNSLMFETIIPRHSRLSEASAVHRPIVLYDIRSLGSQAYFRLAKEIIKRHS